MLYKFIFIYINFNKVIPIIPKYKNMFSMALNYAKTSEILGKTTLVSSSFNASSI